MMLQLFSDRHTFYWYYSILLFIDQLLHIINSKFITLVLNIKVKPAQPVGEVCWGANGSNRGIVVLKHV